MSLTKTAQQEIGSYEAINTILNAIAERIKNPPDTRKVTDDAMLAIADAKEAQDRVNADRSKFKEECKIFVDDLNKQRGELSSLKKDLEASQRDLSKSKSDHETDRHNFEEKKTSLHKKDVELSTKETRLNAREESVKAAEDSINRREQKLEEKERNVTAIMRMNEERETKLRQALGG